MKRGPKKSSDPRKNPPWATVRKCHLMTYPECRACGATQNVVVHHLRYRGQRGHGEKPGDLMTLCEFHHNDYHRRFKLENLIENTLAYVAAFRDRSAELQLVEDFLNG